MTENTNETAEVWEPPVEPTKSIPADIPPAESVIMLRESSQVVEGESVKMEQSATFSVLADDVEMKDSAAFVVKADVARVEDSVTFILAAGEVKGNVTTVFTPVTAAIVGLSLMIGMWLIRPRR